MSSKVQVPTTHYSHDRYMHKARWASYWHQMREVTSLTPASVLEVGVGTGVVAATLRGWGIAVKTLDIDASLSPDVLGSVTAIPLPDGSVDVALAGQVLEHLPWEEVGTALREMRRVSRKGIVVSVPDRRHTLLFCSLQFPLFGRREFAVRIPTRKPHRFDGQHHWELGVPGYPIARFKELAASCGLKLIRSCAPSDVPTKHFFVFEKI